MRFFFVHEHENDDENPDDDDDDDDDDDEDDEDDDGDDDDEPRCKEMSFTCLVVQLCPSKSWVTFKFHLFNVFNHQI